MKFRLVETSPKSKEGSKSPRSSESLLLLSPSVTPGWISLYLSATPYLLKAAFYPSLSSPSFLSSLISLSLLHSFLSLPPHLLSPSWICFTLHCSRPRKDPGWMSHPLTICCPKALQAPATSKDPTSVHRHARMYISACLHIAYPFSFLRKEMPVLWTHTQRIKSKWTKKKRSLFPNYLPLS